MTRNERPYHQAACDAFSRSFTEEEAEQIRDALRTITIREVESRGADSPIVEFLQGAGSLMAAVAFEERAISERTQLEEELKERGRHARASFGYRHSCRRRLGEGVSVEYSTAELLEKLRPGPDGFTGKL